MFRAIIGCIGIGLTLGASLQASEWNVRQSSTSRPAVRNQPSALIPAAVSPQRAFLDRYCVTCHNQRSKTGQDTGLMLDRIDVAAAGESPQVWEKVVGRIRSGTMPPAGMPRPDKAAYDSIASWLEAALDRAAMANPNPGRKAAVHRLNRAEYTNAIRDLLGIDIDAGSLPPDDLGYGFDNIAEVLSVSPALLERYMLAAGKISRLAIGDASIRPVIQTYTVPLGVLQGDRMSEQLPFGSRGGIAARHYFPADGEYVFKIKMQRTHTNQIRGLDEPNQVELRLDRKRIKVFTIGGEGPLAPWTLLRPGSSYEQTADAGLEVRAPVKAGTRQLGVSFRKTSSAPEGVLEPRLGVYSYPFYSHREGDMGVDSVQISGPYGVTASGETPGRRQIFVCYPISRENEQACAKQILSTLARRAYRRPVTAHDVRTLLSIYTVGRGKGSFESGIELALRAILVDPDFLYRVERDPGNVAPATPYRLSGVELASRLSFFLWSSIPDDELLDLAARGKLGDSTVLEQQVRRMLRDARSKALVDNFVGQWLWLRNIRGHSPNPDLFPDFDGNLREAFQRETELFVESQLREDRSLVDLLAANYSLVNERLARHYGIPNVYGSHFRRVTFSDDTRGGLLGQGSLLTVTSYAHRTSPTVRGKWVLENLLGAPPPPPPPNVPTLEEDSSEDGTSRSVRERMEQHRTNPVCASCHAAMDPLGFALENYDAIGRWRTDEGNIPIDASGVLPDGTKFQGPAGLRTTLLNRREEFVATITRKLLTYALGRGLEYYDAPAVRTIAREAALSDYRWSAVILGIVKSTPFQMRSSSEP